MLKNLVFDWGGVLSVSQHNEAIKRFEALGLTNAETYFEEGKNWKGIFGEIENGKIGIEDFLSAISQLCGKNITFEEVAYAWWGFFHHLTPGLLHQLYIWEKEGYNLYILTNNNPFMMSYINGDQFAPEGRPFHTYFKKIYVSYEIGLEKPDRAIYEHMLKDGDMKAEETLFIDDREQNTKGAESVGINTYLVKNSEAWIPDLINKFLKH